MLLQRKYLAALHDTFMAGVSLHLALYLRLGDAYVSTTQGYLLPATIGFSLIMLCASLIMRLHQRMWRYASMQDLVIITKTVTVAIVIFIVCMFLFTRLESVPRSVPVIHWLLLLAMLGGSRFAYRMLKENRISMDLSLVGNRIPVLLVSAGDEAELFLRETQRNPGAPYRVIGIVDDRRESKGRNLHGVRIWGQTDSIEYVVEKLTRKVERPQRIILTDPFMDGSKVRNLLEVSDKISVPLARLPRMSEIKQGITDTLDIKPIAVEDLLGRPQNTHDKQVMRGFIEGKVVMITGAGGSIGSELCHQVAQYGPTSIILLEYSEYNLYRIDAELAETHPTLERKCIFADVRDTLHIDKVMAHYHPDIVFHAAAIKHVHIAEHNPEETIFTNVFGTKNVADACVRNKVGAMILISTDKAVNPTSVMGASKRVAESYCQALGQEEKHNATRFITVRFGNVLGSTGSVVPLFYKQLEKGGPITITHPDMMRYFMTIREAVELVIYAAAMGEKMRDQNGMIFVLDMGQPVRIVDLAVQMIKLAGLRPNEDIAIEYTGLRPGEKLHEELFHFAENSVPTSHESILLAAPRVAKLKALEAQLLDLLTLAQARKTPELIHQLQKTVAEYSPSTIF